MMHIGITRENKLTTLISKLDETNIFRLFINIGSPLLTLRQIIDEINGACDSVEGADADAVLLLHLQGSAGLHDLFENCAAIDVQAVNQWERALRRIERLNALTISTIDGYCGGLGLAILLVTDYRIAAKNVMLNLRIGIDGILPDMALRRLVNQIGMGWARRLGLFGMELAAEIALEIGLIDELKDGAEHAAKTFICSIDEAIRQNLPMRRRLILEESLVSYEDAIGVHLAASDRFLRDRDNKQAAQSKGLAIGLDGIDSIAAADVALNTKRVG